MEQRYGFYCRSYLLWSVDKEYGYSGNARMVEGGLIVGLSGIQTHPLKTLIIPALTALVIRRLRAEAF